ncbi:MAG: polysaccharide deacetylase family protein [Myxococcaceae bacterium]
MANGNHLLRRAAKSAVANVLHYSGARRAIAAARRLRAGGRRILILSYHRVVDDFTGEVQRSIPGLLISRETFRRHLDEVQSAGFDVVSLEDALNVISGERAAKRDVCVITFDDGYRDIYRHAFPLLRELGLPATIYLASGFVGTDKRFNHDRLFHLLLLAQKRRLRPMYELLPTQAVSLLEPVLAGAESASGAVDRFLSEATGSVALRVIEGLAEQLGGGEETSPEQGDVMTWEDARRMADAGISFGAHTVGHSVLPLEEPERAEWEILESRTEIERQLGRPCLDFAYCNGWYSDELVRMLTRAGYRSAVTTEDLPNRVGGDPYTLKRKVLWENFSLGFDGGYSSCLTGCQIDDVFTSLGAGSVVIGRRAQRAQASIPLFTEPEPLHGGF